MIATCSQAGCPLPNGGQCLEGFDPPDSGCPHYDASPSDANLNILSSSDATKRPLSPMEAMVPLHHGDELDAFEASALMKGLVSSVIVIAGPPESGKTTILTSIFESFRMGPVDGHRFAGSRTLRAFERRCHPSRTASRRAMSTTDRTRKMETRYLHLKVKPNGDSHSKHLLFTDISGEVFRLARDLAHECKKLTVLRRADHFAAVLDGAKIMDSRHRGSVAEDARGILRRTTSLGMIDRRCDVEIICSKFDLVSNGPRAAEALAYLSDIEAELASEFGDSVGRMTFHHVAARPSGTLLPFAHKVGALLDVWITRTSRNVIDPGHAAIGGPTRPFDRFGWNS